MKTFLCIPLSAADAAANSNGNKNVLANGLITFLINGKPTVINGPRNLPRNQPNCIFLEFFCESLESCAFDKLILAEELFAKIFGSFRKLSIS